MILRWLLHAVGMDDPSGPIYLALSGWVADLGLLGGALVLYRKHNCHQVRCPRIGKHLYEGTPYCTRHHPKGSR